MQESDFFPNYPGTLVPISGGNIAFVPNLLPARFSCDVETLDINDAALLALGELRAIIPNMPNPSLITSPFLRREAVLSSKIEGTKTRLEQLYLFEADNPATDTDFSRDAREVHNYVIALEHGLSQLDELPICNRLLFEMHKLLMAGIRRDRGRLLTPGEFRREQVFLGKDNDIRLARYVPPPETVVDQLMLNLAKYLGERGKDHPNLIRIAMAHYQFEAIHPFKDGNGRIGRLLISLLLALWKILPEPLLYLSAYFERNRDEYIDSLWAVSREGNWAGWVRFFLRGVYEEAEDATHRANSLLRLRETYRASLQRRKGSSSALALVDHLFRSPFITISEAATVLGLKYGGAKKNVDKLCDAGILAEHESREWNRLFFAKSIMEMLG